MFLWKLLCCFTFKFINPPLEVPTWGKSWWTRKSGPSSFNSSQVVWCFGIEYPPSAVHLPDSHPSQYSLSHHFKTAERDARWWEHEHPLVPSVPYQPYWHGNRHVFFWHLDRWQRYFHIKTERKTKHISEQTVKPML